MTCDCTAVIRCTSLRRGHTLNLVNETLQELVERRLREMGQRRGRGENISLREAWLRLPEDANGTRAVSYETVRRIRENGHHRIGDETADALATMLGVPVAAVLQAAGQRPRLGKFELPSRADRLTESERTAVLGVVDAILDAVDQDRGDVVPILSKRERAQQPQKKAARPDPKKP